MFCLHYYPQLKAFFDSNPENVTELKITYNREDSTLPDFLEHFPNYTIIIEVTGLTDTDIELLKALYEKYPNIKFKINFFLKDSLEKIQESGLPFFFSNYVVSMDQMNGLAAYSPTDMYICEELAFSLDKVSDFLHKKNIKVRVIPNICQSSFEETPSIKTFFVRPEDVDIYSTFVDVFELAVDRARQSVLYKVYNQQRWFGKIKEIIPSFKDELDSRYILSTFGLVRSKCGKRCMYNSDKCQICERLIELADALEENNLIIKTEKTEELKENEEE